MIDALRDALAATPFVNHALLFGSRARGTAHAQSDVDVAIGTAGRRRVTATELGDLVSRLETSVGCRVDVIVLHEAPIVVAFNAFREGRLLLVRDRHEFVAEKARAMVAYYDFRPIHDLCVAGALKAARRG